MIRSILLASFFSALIWAMSIPVWQFPDEQAHFAQVQNYAEIGRSPVGIEDLSYEVFEAERILGTLRDEFGRNKYTYNPNYRIDYSNTKNGLEEDYLKKLPLSSRVDYVKRESPRYPPLFYLISSLGYKAFYNGDLFSRVIGVRLISVMIFVLLVYFGFKLFKEIFPGKKYLWVGATIMLMFHPMLTFVSSGINNDNLSNMMSTVILYFLVKILRRGINYKDLFLLALTFGLGVISKQLVYLLAFPIGIVIVYSLIKAKPKFNQLAKYSAVGLLGLGVMLVLVKNGGFWLPFWPRPTINSPGYDMSVMTLFKTRLIQLYRETIPWYWGVFNWLGVVLPINVIRLIKIVMGLSLVGWIKYFYKKIRMKNTVKHFKVSDFSMLLLIMANLFYVVTLVFWDINLTRSMGFSHGLQGRYFFPLISAQMIIFSFGLWQLVKGRMEKYFPLLVFIGFSSLNLVALYRVLSSYYQILPLRVLVVQISQYKPEFAKWPYLGVYFGLHLFFMSLFFCKLIGMIEPLKNVKVVNFFRLKEKK